LNPNPYEIKGETHLRYRPDIDGLRALAVLSVVIGHAFPALLPGGFIGVDVFYVISGYLISGIILKDLELGRFTFRRFFAHRFRRIIPALSVVLVAVWIAGWFVLLPDEYLSLGRHIAAGATYLSNWLLWLEAGYFDPASSLKPLLHLWSLGVEEQFYFVWPLLLVFVFRKNLSVGKVIVVLALSSFIWNVARVDQHSTEVFYLLPSRLWELLAGGGLAYAQRQKKKILNSIHAAHLSSWAAAIFFAAGLVWIDHSRAFPGYWALMPVIAAILFILAGPKGWVNQRILSSRPAIFIGVISYPLYLWHWPILAFLNIVRGESPSSPLLVSSLMVVAVALAWLTWKWIELPIRTRVFLHEPLPAKERKHLRVGFAAIVVTCLIGVVTRANHGFEFRIKGVEHYYAQTAWEASADKACQDKFGYPFSNFCKANSLTPELLVLGDSHANHLYPGLAKSP
jgi:peptidoglycan/LPS O-acetylase OafA/YrhL